MSGALYLHRLSLHVAVGENRIGGIRLVGTIDIFAACYGQTVCQFGATLRDEQVVIAIFLIDVRSFGIASTSALPQWAALGELFARCRVYLTEHDGIVGIRHHIAFAIFKPQRWIDALLLKPYRFAPWPLWIFGCYHEVAAITHIGGDHIIHTFMVANGRCIDAQP